ncbi:hypothetical protein PspLS_06074 [Pyricularia sp. CBS 133598]|nr:hypothetical protein PspLS_06074 [Pyricularia sp. CBS 133598]
MSFMPWAHKARSGLLVAAKHQHDNQPEGGKARVRLATEKDAIRPRAGRFVTNDKAPTTLKIRLPPTKASGGQAINGTHPWFRVLRAAGSRRFGTGIYSTVWSPPMWYLSQLCRGRVSDGM